MKNGKPLGGTLVFVFSLLLCSWAREPLGAETAFWVRNTDAASFVWWSVPAGSRAAGAVLPLLPTLAGGPRTVAPGERVRITLGDGQDLVGAFVPWATSPSYLTPVTGGFLSATQAPTRGTLLVNAPSFAAANRGQALTGPLQAWGLVPSSVALGGPGWSSLPQVLGWGPGFQPGGSPWPKGWPVIQGLQVADRDGALWVALSSDRPWTALPPGVRLSLVLGRPGAFFEWPLAGDPTVWLWNEGAPAQAVGWSARVGSVVQGWVPWDRLAETDRQTWHRAGGRWALLVTRGEEVTVLDIGAFLWAELP